MTGSPAGSTAPRPDPPPMTAQGDLLPLTISGGEVVGSFLGRVLAEIAHGARLPATRTGPAGIRPAVATTLVESGLTPPVPVTAPDADRAMSPVRAAPPGIPPAHPEGGA